MRAVVISVITVVIVLCGILGFHWIAVGTSHGHKLCVMAKDQLSFDATLLSADSEIGFALQHPILAGRIATGHGECVQL